MKTIILTDLRALPLLTAIFTYKKFKKQEETISLLISERVIDSSDFGHFFPVWYKKLKIAVVKLFFDLKIVDKVASTQLDNEDELGVISSLSSITLDSESTAGKYPNLYSGLSNLAKGAKEITDFLMHDNPTEVYLFNGRTASSEPIVRFLWGKKIKCFFYEFGVKFGTTYTLYDFPIHNAYRFGLRLVDMYNSKPFSAEKIKELGEKYMLAKINNVFTKNYTRKAESNYDIVIFLGSDHEYSNLNEEIYDIKLIGNLNLVNEVFNKYGNDKKYAVRAHPNQTVDPNWEKALEPISFFCDRNGMDFYDPLSTVSSYDLIAQSNLIAVELSSICIDAIIFEKEVDIFGKNDLKAILDTCPQEISIDKNALKNYVCEVLSLAEYLSHHNLPFKWSILKKVIFRFDWVILKLYKTKLS